MATWLEDTVTALKRLGGKAHYDAIYAEVAAIRGTKLPRSWKAIIRRTIETNSSDSDVFGGNDIFYSVNGIGQGSWGLR